jgi:hypothetical protein
MDRLGHKQIQTTSLTLANGVEVQVSRFPFR